MSLLWVFVLLMLSDAHISDSISGAFSTFIFVSLFVCFGERVFLAHIGLEFTMSKAGLVSLFVLGKGSP